MTDLDHRDKAASARWGDLGSRGLSAAVMIAVGLAEIWMGGITFAVLIVALIVVMIWELTRMTVAADPVPLWATPIPLSLACGLALVLALWLHAVLASQIAVGCLVLPWLILRLAPGQDRSLRAVYGLAIVLAGYGLVGLRETAGPVVIFWLVAVVVASDVLGYFVGRLVGGPRFWPRISPKKTWSGTIAGWVGAGLVGLGFVVMGSASLVLVALSVVVAFAGQLGDITESWIKRRAGVKDTSRVIPGHGGVLDRFDALIGAVVLLWLIQPFVALQPLVGG